MFSSFSGGATVLKVLKIGALETAREAQWKLQQERIIGRDLTPEKLLVTIAKELEMRKMIKEATEGAANTATAGTSSAVELTSVDEALR